jgi:hypothetical protein
MPKKMTTTDFVLKAIAKHGDRYDYSETEYFGNANPVAIRCKIHGVFTPLANDHLSKKAGCPDCAGVRRMTKDEFVAKAVSVHGDKYDYSEVVYKNTDTKVDISCKEGHEFPQTPHDHLQGAGCPYCAGLSPITFEQFLSKSAVVHGDKYGYDRVKYIDYTKIKVELVCRHHGASFWQIPQHHAMGHGCPKCGGAEAMTTLDYVTKCRKLFGDKFDYTNTVYVRKNEPLRIDCRKHGEFWAYPFNHLRGNDCPKCANVATTKPELAIQEMFAEFRPIKDRTVLEGKELDLLFPEYKVAVEVNGIYWHSDSRVTKHEHLDKTENCAKQGIKLLHFTDRQILLKPEIVNSMVRSALKVSNKLAARKCEIRQIAFKDYEQFFNDNHISGNTSAKISYGLYFEDMLVSCMSFSTPRFDKSADWEIIRFASLLNTSVRGAASKLFAEFVKNHSPTEVISYADRRYGSGKVYERLEFSFERNTEVGYSYHHNKGSVVSRYQAQKHKLPALLGDKFQPELSERDNMVKAGYHLVYDCGSAVWRWSK